MNQGSMPSWRCRHGKHQWGVRFERGGRSFEQCERAGCLAERFISPTGKTPLTRDCYGEWTKNHHALMRLAKIGRVLDEYQDLLRASDGI